MRTNLIRGIIMVLVGVAFFVVPGRARGDSCVGASSVAGMNDKWKVDGAFDKKGKAWSYVLTNRKTGEKRSGLLSLANIHKLLVLLTFVSFCEGQ